MLRASLRLHLWVSAVCLLPIILQHSLTHPVPHTVDSPKCARLLCNHRSVDISATTSWDFDVLDLAASSEGHETLKHLLKSHGDKIDVNRKRSSSRYSWEGYMAFYGSRFSLRIFGSSLSSSLVKHFASFSHGESPLTGAARHGNVANVRLLLSHGADPSLRCDDGRTALDYCRQDGPFPA